MFLGAKVRRFFRSHNPIDKLFYIPNVWYITLISIKNRGTDNRIMEKVVIFAKELVCHVISM